MTRINIIPPKALHDKLLNAELVEIGRVLHLAKNHFEKHGSIINKPDSFTLGKGHVKFFYDKALYIINRYKELREEFYYRNKKPYNKDHLEKMEKRYWDLPNQLCNDWEPTYDDQLLVINRISKKPYKNIDKPLNLDKLWA